MTTEATTDARASERAPTPWLGRSLGLAVLGGALYFLGFPGFDLWPCAFVALVPLALMLEAERESPWKRRMALTFTYGMVQFLGGYYWMQGFLAEFSGFGAAITWALTGVFCAYLALGTVALGFVYGRARERGHSPTPILVAGTVALESAFPMIFPSYLGNSLHDVPVAIQIADLGGPLLISAFVALVNGALVELWLARDAGRPMPRLAPGLALSATVAVLGYGAYRMAEVDARVASAPRIEIAMVQVNMGTFQKREDPIEGHRRHLEQTYRIERSDPPDLFVWPESAFTFAVPSYDDVSRLVTRGVETPVLFGGLDLRDRRAPRPRVYNTAFLVDAEGHVAGTYDKTFLVPFGEYIPFGDWFPSLYDLSPNTGRFEPGTSLEALTSGPARMSVFICYEDLLPEFTRRLVQHGRPNLLVNLTNDAWYGDTHEPHIHLALAKFRAVEHHRALVRSTNSGVSAFIDPVGRVLDRTGVFTREDLVASMPLLDRGTAFEVVGAYPAAIAGWFGMLWMVFRSRRRHDDAATDALKAA